MAVPTRLEGFYTLELNKTEWDVPLKYQDLAPVGTGAYGQVWYVCYRLCRRTPDIIHGVNIQIRL